MYERLNIGRHILSLGFGIYFLPNTKGLAQYATGANGKEP
jgi:hypothetical protein